MAIFQLHFSSISFCYFFYHLKFNISEKLLLHHPGCRTLVERIPVELPVREPPAVVGKIPLVLPGLRSFQWARQFWRLLLQRAHRQSQTPDNHPMEHSDSGYLAYISEFTGERSCRHLCPSARPSQTAEAEDEMPEASRLLVGVCFFFEIRAPMSVRVKFTLDVPVTEKIGYNCDALLNFGNNFW